MIQMHAYKMNFKLVTPMSISFHTWYYSENIIVSLSYKGITGYGEAAPFKPITGDSQEDVIEQCKHMQSLSIDPQKDTIEILHEFFEHSKYSLTFKAALDYAYHDLLARIKKVPVYQLYATTPRFVPNSVTVFIKPTLEATVAETKRIYKNYPDLKLLKIKLKGKGDLDRVRAIKCVSPSHMQFILDANQGFHDPIQAVKMLTDIGNILGNVILVEEPCEKGDMDKLRYVTKHMMNMLVFADESAATLDDVKNVIHAKAAHGVNIKLQKAGGIYPGKQIALLCKKAGLKIMVGSMFDGPLATAASTHFAVSTENLILSDLDMDLDMPKHTKGNILFEKGYRIPLDSLGFGITLDTQKIKKLVQKGIVIFEKII